MVERSTPYICAGAPGGKRQPHHDQSDQYLVDEDESVVGPGSGGTPPLTAAPFLQRRLVRGLPLRGELFDQLAKTCTGDTGQGGMGGGGTRLGLTHNLPNPCGPWYVTDRNFPSPRACWYPSPPGSRLPRSPPDFDGLRAVCDRLGFLGCYVYSVPEPTGCAAAPVDRCRRGHRQRQQHRLPRRPSGRTRHHRYRCGHGRLPRQPRHDHRHHTTRTRGPADPPGRHRQAHPSSPATRSEPTAGYRLLARTTG